MQKSNSYPKYRWIIAVLFLLPSALSLYCVVMVSPIMTTMMEELNVGLSVIGWASTIVTVMSGIFQLLGVIVIGRWGIKWNYVLSSAFFVLGNLLCMFCSEITMLLVGRALVGIGFGLCGAAVAGTIFMWFPPTERPALFTANSVVCTGIMFIGYNITIPMLEGFGSWKPIFGVCAAVSAVILAGWLVLGKEFNIDGEPQQRQKADPFTGLKLAFQSKALWKLSIVMTAVTVMNYGINFYYPTYLSTVRGLSAAAAGSVTSVSQIAGAIGSFAGGAAAVALGKRRIIIIPTTIITLLTVLGLISFEQTMLLMIVMFIYGFTNSFRTPAAQSASTEVEGMTPAMASGANFMLYGFGSFMTMVISPVLGMLEQTMGLSMAMLLFCGGLALIGLIASFTIPETGPKAKKV